MLALTPRQTLIAARAIFIKADKIHDADSALVAYRVGATLVDDALQAMGKKARLPQPTDPVRIRLLDAGHHKISMIKAVRAFTNFDLRTAKDVVEASMPYVIEHTMRRVDAELHVQAILAAGGNADLVTP